MKIQFSIISGNFNIVTISFILSFYNVKLISEKHSNWTAGGWLGYLSFIKDGNSIFILKDNQNILIGLIFYLFFLDNIQRSIFLLYHYKPAINSWWIQKALIKSLVYFPCLKWCFFFFRLPAHREFFSQKV